MIIILGFFRKQMENLKEVVLTGISDKKEEREKIIHLLVPIEFKKALIHLILTYSGVWFDYLKLNTSFKIEKVARTTLHLHICFIIKLQKCKTAI